MKPNRRPISSFHPLHRGDPTDYELYEEEQFHYLLYLERKRLERSNRPVLLMLLDVGTFGRHKDKENLVPGLAAALFSVTRETDIKGWYRDGSILGVLFCDVVEAKDGALAREAILNRIRRALRSIRATEAPVSWRFFSPVSDHVAANGPDEPEVFAPVDHQS